MNTQISIRTDEIVNITSEDETYVGMSNFDLSKYRTVIAPWTLRPANIDIKATTIENIATTP